MVAKLSLGDEVIRSTPSKSSLVLTLWQGERDAQTYDQTNDEAVIGRALC